MHTSDSLRKNHELIKTEVDSLPAEYGQLTKAQFFYTHASITNLDSIAAPLLNKRSKKFIEYSSVLNLLLMKFNNPLEPNTSKDIEMVLYVEYLKKILEVFNRALEIVRIDKNHQEDANKLYQIQLQLESLLQTHFNPSFKLPRIINMVNITRDYNGMYQVNYGTGAFGFFTLPIKKYFQQSTRAAEIKFLEQIESKCALNTKLSMEQKNQIKLSALNLVAHKISAETFGANSNLLKIIKARIEQSGVANTNNEIIDDLFSELEKLKISTPMHLQDFYNNNLEKTDIQPV